MSSASNYDVVAIGEPLVQFSPQDPGPLSYASLFDKHAAGSESNVLIGVSRLGHKTAMITKLGADELSRFILMTLRGEDVDTHWISTVKDKTCGVYITQRNYPVPGKSDVIYFRRDSAASTLSVKDVPEGAISGTKILHLSGITPALSESCRRASMHAAKLAKKHGVSFSFDPNYRKKLWSADKASRVFKELVAMADMVFLDKAEASMILGTEQQRRRPEATTKAIAEMGPTTVVLKLGAEGGLMGQKQGKRVHVPSFRVPTVDAIGAGDAVASGFLSGLLYKKDLRTCLQWAAVSSALVVMRRGDFENLPTLPALQSFLSARGTGGAEFDLR